MTAAIIPPQIERLLGLVSPRVGVIRELTRVPRGLDEPSPPVLYHAALSSFDFRKAHPLERAAAGKGLTDAEAMGGAIGEAVERYCASHLDRARVRRLPFSRAGDHCVPAWDCVLYSASQYARPGFPYLPLAAETELDWTPAREIPQDREVLAPTALIYLYGTSTQPSDSLCPPTSNGLAAGPDLASAILSGLCELVERDAFLLHWMNKLSAPEIDLGRAGGVASSIRAHYARFGVETRVFNVTTDVPIPVMMAVSIDRSGRGPAAVVGLGCHPDPRRAVLRSLFEICQVRPGEVRRHETGTGRRLSTYADVRTLEDHSGFFAAPERLAELSFLLESGRTQDIPASPDSSTTSELLEATVAALVRSGCRVVYVDLTTPDVAEFGIRVVRIIATGLQPIHFGHGEERLGGKRLFEVPRRLGYGVEVRSEADLNPCPHPLA